MPAHLLDFFFVSLGHLHLLLPLPLNQLNLTAALWAVRLAVGLHLHKLTHTHARRHFGSRLKS